MEVEETKISDKIMKKLVYENPKKGMRLFVRNDKLR
jgi:hypothetical protein